MRLPILSAGALALAACGTNGQSDNTAAGGENLTAENIVSNDVTAIDAVTGDSANELLPIVLDNNVHINEYKVATCDIRPGRRPRGKERLELVEGYRHRAGVKD